MIEYKPISSLTLDEARVLLEPEAAKVLVGIAPGALAGAGEMGLIDALASTERPRELWVRRFAGVYVSLLDVNRASRSALARIPRLIATDMELLVKARPYFTLADLSVQGAGLQEVAERAGRYLMHEGYVFVDKPRGRMIELVPASTGVLVTSTEGADPASMEAALHMAGLLEMARDSEERLLVCYWDVSFSLPERPPCLRAFKESDVVQTVAPFLEDAWGKVRLPYPDRLDLALHEEADQTDWEQITKKFRLSPVQRYTTNYGSVRIKAHPHDLGALYRGLRALAKEAIVHFVEPTYLVFDNSQDTEEKRGERAA